jgi:hypothetical protein
MEAFVYCWTNLDNNKKYVGYHKGSTDDGYICSSLSESFWRDWDECSWSRQIIAKGTVEDCVILERKILQSLDLKSDEWYNNNCGGSVIFTDEIREKCRNIGEKNPMFGKKGKEHPAFGYKKTEEAKRTIAAKLKNKKKSENHRKNIIEAHRSEQYIKKVSKPIYVYDKLYSSIKDAVQNSGYSHWFINTRLRDENKSEVRYANANQ